MSSIEYGTLLEIKRLIEKQNDKITELGKEIVKELQNISRKIRSDGSFGPG